MSFGQAVTSVLRQYVGFSGRARRSEYWFFYLFTLLVTGIPYAIVVALVGTTAASDPSAELSPVALLLLGLIGLIGLALFLPSLAVAIRRLHDTGRSGWWYLISLVPFVGGIVLLVFFLLDSEPGANRHGPSPKGGVAHTGGAYGGSGYGAPSAPEQRFGPPPQA